MSPWAALFVGSAFLAVAGWWCWAHCVVCCDLRVGRWHGRAARATAFANAALVLGVIAYVVGYEILRVVA